MVADEVRNLAQRSAQAAKDTAALIEESVAKSGEGQLQVDRVAAAIRALTTAASEVMTLVEQVRAGAEEQTRGIEHGPGHCSNGTGNPDDGRFRNRKCRGGPGIEQPIRGVRSSGGPSEHASGWCSRSLAASRLGVRHCRHCGWHCHHALPFETEAGGFHPQRDFFRG